MIWDLGAALKVSSTEACTCDSCNAWFMPCVIHAMLLLLSIVSRDGLYYCGCGCGSRSVRARGSACVRT